MSINLTAGSIPQLSNTDTKSNDFKPIVQVVDLRLVQSPVGGAENNKERYRVLFSDGVFHQQGMLASLPNELVRNNQLHKGSIVLLTDFVCSMIRGHFCIIIVHLKVIRSKCDIIGDPKIFTSKKTPSSEISKSPIIDLDSCSQTQSNEQKGQSSDNVTVAAKDTIKDASMTMEKNKDDDIRACFEKLEKIGWGTEDPLYDTALLLFLESAEYRKLWLLLRPESCGKWVKNAGSKLGLLG
ncbi:nucleic acid-binding, OB-fold protein [Tanacetum coccineum]